MQVEIPEPGISRFLFGNTKMSWVWLILRVYVGYEWLTAGWGKIGESTWVGSEAGTSLQGFLNGALQKATGAHPSVSWWYAYFISHVALPNAAFISYLVAFGEFLVGVGLILGAFAGIAAFFGAFMNMNFLFAGTVSINPFLLLIELFLILAWRNSGWWGLDRWLLPTLGVPWQPGKVFRK